MPSLKQSLWAAMFVVVCSCYGFAQEYRTWTASVEGFPVEAKYRGFSRRVTNGLESTTVTLQKRDDNATITVPLTDLSQADQDYVKALINKDQAEREQRRMGGQAEARAELEKRRTEREAKRKADEEKRAAEKVQREAQIERSRVEAEKRAELETKRIEQKTSTRQAKIVARAECRTWVDLGGEFQVEAILFDFDGATVQLKRKDNGKTVSIALEKLSFADQTHVKETMKEILQAERPASSAERAATGESSSNGNCRSASMPESRLSSISKSKTRFPAPGNEFPAGDLLSSTEFFH